jgi:hypothetical protein
MAILTYKGTAQDAAVFVYQITAKGFCGSIYRKGTFTLIRQVQVLNELPVDFLINSKEQRKHSTKCLWVFKL